jgi:hypothetical protein
MRIVSYIIIILLMQSRDLVFAQIRVFESEKQDSTEYQNGTKQDSIFIVYKGENNRSTITIFAGLNNIDSLNFEWSKYNSGLNDFDTPFRVTNSVKTDTIFYGTKPGEDMNDYEGGYRVHIYDSSKNIDTVFFAWIWYQDFFINTLSVISSSCKRIELLADTTFQDTFVYYDLSLQNKPILKKSNHTDIKWIMEPPTSVDTGYRARVSLPAPIEPTTYIAFGIDYYGYNRVRSLHIDETKMDNRGYPILRAVKSEFSGIHGAITDENKPSKDTAINVEAPHGVMFFNASKNADLFEWVFYNHQDWYIDESDTTLLVSSLFEPTDSIYYEHPVRHSDFQTSPEGYDVKLSVWGPEYNNSGERCVDVMRKVNFVLVDTTQFPNHYMKMPNVFTPNSSNNNYFYFMKTGDDYPVKSIRYFSVKIYNRWGNKVYEYEDNTGKWQELGNDKPGWDGTTRVGTKAKPGVYYYAIVAEGWDGRDFKVSGYVHIFY